MIRHLGPHTDVDGLVADAREEGRAVHVVVAGPTKQATLAAFAEGEQELVVDRVAELARNDPFTFADLSGLLGQVAVAHPGFHVTVVDR